MKGFFFILLTVCISFWGCMSSRTQILSAELSESNKKLFIVSVDTDFDGMKKSSIEEQIFAIGNCLAENSKLKSEEQLFIKIKMFEKSFFTDGEYIHSLFLKCCLYNSENKEVAVLSEYSTGHETFYSPIVQEKYLRNCFSKIETMSL